jgi:hypothetical protein
MTDSTLLSTLNGPPDASQVATLREQASEEGASVMVTFPAGTDETKRFVVSPRGTCVVLQDLREESFNPSVSSEDVAAALRD